MGEFPNNESKFSIYGIAPWKIVKGEPRHNTWHQSLHVESLKNGHEIKYFGVKSSNFNEKWITNFFGKSILRAYARISLIDFIKFSKILKRKNETQLIYIFEGSISWLLSLTCLALVNRNTIILCNLFSSSKYLEIFKGNSLKSLLIIRILKLHQRLFENKAKISFDTLAMSEWVNKNLNIKVTRFPVPGSFPKKQLRVPITNHFKILINLRNYDINNLKNILENSCKYCEFWIPRGSLDRAIPLAQFSKYKNLNFEKQNIPVQEYEKYFNYFDYSIFLYEPTIDASGRLFDSILAGLPVCVPNGASEWANIAKSYTNHCLFDLRKIDSIQSIFMHPKFNPPELRDEPFFNPNHCFKELLEITKFNAPAINESKWYFGLLGIVLYLLHSTFTLFSNFMLGLNFRISKILRKIVYIGDSELSFLKLRGRHG